MKDAGYFSRAFGAVQSLVKNRRVLAMHDVSAGGLVTTLLEMVFANADGGLDISTEGFVAAGETDLVKILFAENPAVVIQVDDAKRKIVEKTLADAGVRFWILGRPSTERVLMLDHMGNERLLGIDHLRDVWFEPSYLLDRMQSGTECAGLRFGNYKKQPLRYAVPASFDGSLASRGIAYRHPEGDGRVRAAIIREKGVNGDREMAYSLYLAGFDVKDVHMTDLMSGREKLEDVNMIVFCGGFSNSDVLGSAKGWASGFRWNDTAKETLRRFYNRADTLSLGICNGCQLMVELGLLNEGGIDSDIPASKRVRMEHNVSHKFESQFVGVTIPANNSVMLGSMAGMKLGIWVAHGEGRFMIPGSLKDYNIAARYSYAAYPANPNGSRGAVAALASADGRHLAMMPHLERAIFPWQCGFYPANRRREEVTPWIDAFINARKWVEANRK